MSLFGNSSASARTSGGLFGSQPQSSSLFQQPQQQSQQSQPQQQAQQQNFQQQVTVQSQQGSQQPQQPEWFSNHKKRTIPNHLAPKKKPGFHINTTSKLSSTSQGTSRRSISGGSSGTGEFNSQSSSASIVSSKDQFNVLSFGSQQRKYINASERSVLFDETIDETFSGDLNSTNSQFNEDMPPTRSIYDLNDEVLISLNKPKQRVDSFISKDPKNFNNVFNRFEEAPKNATAEPEISPLTTNESAILVFGYPESLSAQVIQHFKEFGDILEEFEMNRLLSNNGAQITEAKKIVPIFSGKNWIKITYDNAGSAVDALQENGAVFNDVLLGVIPYNKNAIEKLKKRRLTDFEDFGSIDLNSYKGKAAKDLGEVSPSEVNYTTRLEIKDGSQFFLKATEGDSLTKNGNNGKGQTEKLGFISSISKYLFGFHEL